MTDLALWGGLECTVNRVGDQWVDQLAQSGHLTRGDDIERLASSGIRVWRYPLLWEHVAPRGLASADWDSLDRRLGRMRHLGLEPIAGLSHHGSGPSYTSLLDPAFAAHLAEYAGAAAARYPWIRRWTPVNEPLSTARFSGLDGHWYPHRTSDADFAAALVNQCAAIASSMRAIRREIPDAELVLTEDVCRHYATPGLAEEAAFRNRRRFLGIDLLCGRVVAEHPLHAWLLRNGIAPSALDAFCDAPSPPAILGANYYVTSDRFLDEKPERAPHGRRFEGACGRYGETEAVRSTVGGMAGHHALLAELWEKYQIPLAIAEVHLGCTREEQVRWLLEAWDAARNARAEGIDVRAVTVWGAFGLFGWDRLVVAPGGTYEPGMFDVRAPAPRPTAVAAVAADLAAGRAPFAPWGGPGWWRRPIRTEDRQVVAVHDPFPSRPLPHPRPSRPLLVTGAGAFSREVVRACELRGLVVSAPGLALDVCDPTALAGALDRLQPWAVVHAAGVRDPGAAERDPQRTLRLHVRAPTLLAEACATRGVRLGLLSSSLVLPTPGPHAEEAATAPRTRLGAAQARGERLALGRHPGALLARCGVVVGLDRPDDPLNLGFAALHAGRPWTVPGDASAVVASLLAHALLDLLIDGERGIWHLAHRRPLVELARSAARLAGLDAGDVHPAAPGGARLVSARGDVLPSCGPALHALARRHPRSGRSAPTPQPVSQRHQGTNEP